MAKNIKALTDDDFEFINGTYQFRLINSIDYDNFIKVANQMVDSGELSEKVLKELIDSFNKKDYIATSCAGYDRTVLHDINKSFSINTSIKRKISISEKAINLWLKKYLNKYSLIEIQNAINTLLVTYQDLTDDNISSQLERKKARIIIG